MLIGQQFPYCRHMALLLRLVAGSGVSIRSPGRVVRGYRLHPPDEPCRRRIRKLEVSALIAD